MKIKFALLFNVVALFIFVSVALAGAGLVGSKQQTVYNGSTKVLTQKLSYEFYWPGNGTVECKKAAKSYPFGPASGYYLFESVSWCSNQGTQAKSTAYAEVGKASWSRTLQIVCTSYNYEPGVTHCVKTIQ